MSEKSDNNDGVVATQISQISHAQVSPIQEPIQEDVDNMTDNAYTGEDENIVDSLSGEGLQRHMSARHLTMISLGGVIGTGLFMSAGQTVQQAGPLGALIAYIVGAGLVYCVMLSLAELSVAMPFAGSFHLYVKKFIGPGVAFTIALLYWLNWAVALGSQFTAAGLLMQYWFPSTPVWLWASIFIVIILALNLMSVKEYGETEFWLSSIKVIAIFGFIAIGILAIMGIVPYRAQADGGAAHVGAIWFSNFYRNGWLPSGILPIFSTFLSVVFALSGAEIVGVAAGETKNPRTAIPRAASSTMTHLAIVFIGSIAVIGALASPADLMSNTSPFVHILENMGIPYAAGVMNIVIVTAILSAANSGLYVGARTLWSLGREGMVDARIGSTNSHGVPVVAIILTMVGSLFALLSSVFAAETIYAVLVSVSGLATLIVWIFIVICHILFRRTLRQEGKSADDLAYKVNLYPAVPIIALVMSAGVMVMILCDAQQRLAVLYTIPCAIAFYGWYHLQRWWAKRGQVAGSKE